MHVIVVGCGRVGSEVALSLASTGHDVIVIDRKSEAFRRLGDDFKGTHHGGRRVRPRCADRGGDHPATAPSPP